MTKISAATVYLNKTWLKEPFAIGYPTTNEQIKTTQQLLHTVLFEDGKSSFSKPSAIQTLSGQLGINPRILENKQALEAIFQTPRPQKLQGKALYEQQYRGIWKASWTRLSDTTRQLFYNRDYINSTYESSTRVWKGYETVYFLKRYLDCKFNPYLYLTLKPIEIITDKLRVKTKAGIRSNSSRSGIGFVSPTEHDDYYDKLITQAFSTRHQNIYQKVFKEVKPDDFKAGRFNSILQAYNEDTESYYHQKYLRGECHRFLLSLNPHSATLAFHNYFRAMKGVDERLSFESLQRQVVDNWNRMTNEQRQKYRSHITFPRIWSQLYKLNWQVLLTMNYIFDVGYVRDAPNDYDWRRDLGSTNDLGPLFYMDGQYYKYYIRRSANKVQELDLGEIRTPQGTN